MEVSVFLQALLVLAVVVVMPLVERLRINAVVGYLAVGMAIGPNGAGMIHDLDGAIELAEFGIVFLLFTLGLELSVDRLKAMRHDIFGLGTAQVLCCGAAVALAAWAIGFPPTTALVLGAALAMSSTAVVAQILTDEGEMVKRLGRVALAVLLFQDIAVAPILAMVPLVGEEAELGSVLGSALMRAVLGVGAVVLIGRYVTPHLFRLAARTRRREVFVALVIFTALGTGYLTSEAGLSMALGAFLSGVVLAGCVFRHQIEADIEPFKGILLGLFFMTIGMILSPGVLLQQGPIIAWLVVGLVTIKALIIFALCRLFKVGLSTAIRIALLLAAGGEFAFVIVGLALANGLLHSLAAQTMIATVAASMALTPVLAMVGRRTQQWLERRVANRTDLLGEESRGLVDHVVILGFGRVGQTVARLLKDLDVPYLALDLDHRAVAEHRAAGANVLYGNAAQIGVLRKAGIGRARMVVVTIDQPSRVSRILSMLRNEYPALEVIVRAHDNAQARALELAGATRAVPETLEASLQLGRSILTTIGLPIDDVRQIIQRVRSEHYERLEPTGGAP